MHKPKRHNSLADLLEGMDDGPNEDHMPHISIRPIGGPFGNPFGGPFGSPFGGMARPGPVIHHASFADLFKNIAKPGPHPSFLDGPKDEKKKDDDKKPVTTPAKAPESKTPVADTKKPAITITDVTAKKPEIKIVALAPPEKPVVAAEAAPITPIKLKLVNPIKKAAEMKK